MPTYPPRLRLPPAVQMAWFTLHPTSFYEACRRMLGDTFTVQFVGYPPWIALTEPNDIKSVFTGKPEDLFAGPANAILKPVLREHSLLLLDAPAHPPERKRMNPAFHGERMMAYGGTMAALTDAALAQWPTGRRFRLHPRLQALTLDVIWQTVFGLAGVGDGAKLRAKIEDFLAAVSSPAALVFIHSNGAVRVSERARKRPWLPIGRIFRLLDELDALLFAEFARRRRDGVSGRDDILSQFLALQDEAGKDLTDAWLRDEMMTLLLAGHETTATALAWLFYHLASNPEAAARVTAEIDAAGGDAITPDAAAKLPYLEAAIKESMRLTPVITWVGRRLERPMRIGRWDLPAGAMVLPNIYLTHRREDLWPAPLRYRPERFLDQPAGPNVFFPFGGGARRCIGMAFANYEMKVVAARVLSRYAFTLPAGYKGRPVRRTITLTPEQGLPVTMTPRR